MSLVMNFQKKDNGIFVMRIEGELNSDTASHFRKEKNQLLEKGAILIGLDCDSLEILASIGIREFIGLYKDLSTVKGKMVFFNMRKPIKDTLKSMGLLQIFTIVDTEEDAMGLLVS